MKSVDSLSPTDPALETIFRFLSLIIDSLRTNICQVLSYPSTSHQSNALKHLLAKLPFPRLSTQILHWFGIPGRPFVCDHVGRGL